MCFPCLHYKLKEKLTQLQRGCLRIIYPELSYRNFEKKNRELNLIKKMSGYAMYPIIPKLSTDTVFIISFRFFMSNILFICDKFSFLKPTIIYYFLFGNRFFFFLNTGILLSWWYCDFIMTTFSLNDYFAYLKTYLLPCKHALMDYECRCLSI